VKVGAWGLGGERVVRPSDDLIAQKPKPFRGASARPGSRLRNWPPKAGLRVSPGIHCGKQERRSREECGSSFESAYSMSCNVPSPMGNQGGPKNKACTRDALDGHNGKRRPA